MLKYIEVVTSYNKYDLHQTAALKWQKSVTSCVEGGESDATLGSTCFNSAGVMQSMSVWLLCHQSEKLCKHCSWSPEPQIYGRERRQSFLHWIVTLLWHALSDQGHFGTGSDLNYNWFVKFKLSQKTHKIWVTYKKEKHLGHSLFF